MRVLLQHDVHEAAEALAELAGQRGRRLLRDHEGGLQRVQLRVRRCAGRQLDGGDADAPDVGLAVVLVLRQHLGRHPVGRADHRAALRVGARECGRHAEVGDLHVAAAVQQDVSGLYVLF